MMDKITSCNSMTSLTTIQPNTKNTRPIQDKKRTGFYLYFKSCICPVESSFSQETSRADSDDDDYSEEHNQSKIPTVLYPATYTPEFSLHETRTTKKSSKSSFQRLSSRFYQMFHRTSHNRMTIIHRWSYSENMSYDKITGGDIKKNVPVRRHRSRVSKTLEHYPEDFREKLQRLVIKVERERRNSVL